MRVKTANNRKDLHHGSNSDQFRAWTCAETEGAALVFTDFLPDSEEAVKVRVYYMRDI